VFSEIGLENRCFFCYEANFAVISCRSFFIFCPVNQEHFSFICSFNSAFIYFSLVLAQNNFLIHPIFWLFLFIKPVLSISYTVSSDCCSSLLNLFLHSFISAFDSVPSGCCSSLLNLFLQFLIPSENDPVPFDCFSLSLTPRSLNLLFLIIEPDPSFSCAASFEAVSSLPYSWSCSFSLLFLLIEPSLSCSFWNISWLLCDVLDHECVPSVCQSSTKSR
jgi:hypothetical protein